MSSAKRPTASDGGTAVSKKPCLQHAFVCPNPHCNTSSKSVKGLHIHLGKSPTCARFLMLKTRSRTQTVRQKPPTVEANEALADVPWDNDDDSIDEELNQADTSNVLEENHGAGGPNDGVGVYSDSANDSALRFGIRFTTEQYHETKLLKILSDANAPHYLYKDIIEWGRAANGDNYHFYPQRSTRKAQVKYLETWLQCQKSRPQQIPTTLPGPVFQEVQTTCFNFSQQLYNLVADRALFGTLHNLDVNINDPFGKYVPTNGLLSTTNSGQWYNQAYHHEVKDPATDFLMPIIMACDETNLRKGGKASSWPLLFTTSILNQKMRNLPIAWRTLGYINNLSYIQSAAEAQTQTKELKAERLHAIFKTILASLIEAQQSGALHNIPLQLGGITKKVNLKVPVIFIIGDLQGGDKICCTTCAYSNKLKRLCRKCNVRGDQSGDPLVQCQKISMVKVIDLVKNNRQDILDGFNQYNVYNAWYDVSYGGCRFGIFSAACPIEPLHSVENGIIIDCLSILYKDEMNIGQKAKLDIIVRRLTLLPRQRYASSGTEPCMPRLLWKDGITTLANLPAKYKVGILFTIVVVSLQEEGKKLFVEVLGSDKRLNEMRQVFQMLLSYWVWLKRDTYWKRGDKIAKERARTAIRVMLQELIRLWPRLRGQGWELAKIHEQLHVPDDIERNGAPQGSHTGPTEHNHIRLVKRPAKGTQQRAEVLDQQLGQRVSDAYIVDMAYQRMTTSYDSFLPEAEIPVQTTGVSPQATKAYMIITLFEEEPSYVIQGLQSNHFGTEFIQFLVGHYGALPGVSKGGVGVECLHHRLFVSTEYVREKTIFRGDANYRLQGPWYDWVMLRWEREDNQRHAEDLDCQAAYGDDDDVATGHLYAPGKILGFVSTSSMDPNVMVVVATCNFSYSRGSVFSTNWQQSYVYHANNRKTLNIELVDTNAIVRHCLMVPNDDNESSYHEIWSQELWGDQFNDCL